MKLSKFCFNSYKKLKCTFLIKSTIRFRASQNNCGTIQTDASAGVAFHTSSILKTKSHQEKENEYAHSVMSNIDSYTSLVRYPMDITKSSANSSKHHKEISAFSEVTTQALQSNLSLEDRKHTQLVHKLVEILPQVSDSDLIQILHNLCLWPSSPKSYSPNFKMIWNKLDDECVSRLKTWDINCKLLIADYWFCLKLNRISEYNKSLILSLLKDIDSLSNTQVVQLMFYVNLQRKVPPNYIKNLEKRLLSVINSVSIEEVGVVCLGFFKTESKVSDFKVIKTIVKHFSSNIEIVHTLTVNAILKFLKKSLHVVHVDSYLPLLHACIPHISQWDIPTSIQLALLSSECNIYLPLLLDKVTEKVGNAIEDARVKDCTKLLQCLSHYNHFPEPKFHENFLVELQKKSRRPEIDAHPRDLVYSTIYYAYLGYYDYSLLQTVLSCDFIRYCRLKSSETKYIIPEIDYCVEVECDDYVGPRLPKHELEVLGERRGNMPNDMRYDGIFVRVMNEVSLTLESLLNEKENILIRHILPQFYSPDIIVRLSKNNNYSLSELCKSVASSSILRPPPGETWVCFVLSSPFSFAFRSEHLTGVTAMKLRQLKKIGFGTVFIPFYELPANKEMRKKYLKEKLELIHL